VLSFVLIGTGLFLSSMGYSGGANSFFNYVGNVSSAGEIHASTFE